MRKIKSELEKELLKKGKSKSKVSNTKTKAIDRGFNVIGAFFKNKVKTKSVLQTKVSLKKLRSNNPFVYKSRIEAKFRIVVDSDSANLIFINFKELRNIIANYPAIKSSFEEFVGSFKPKNYQMKLQKADLANFTSKNIEKYLAKKTQIPAREGLNTRDLSNCAPKEFLSHIKLQ